MIFVIRPERTHCCNRRWQVWNEGYRSGRSAQGAPVLNTHRMPFMTERRLFQGRPRPSGRVLGFGISGSRIFHCSSFKSRAWHIPGLMPLALHGRYNYFRERDPPTCRTEKRARLPGPRASVLPSAVQNRSFSASCTERGRPIWKRAEGTTAEVAAINALRKDLVGEAEPLRCRTGSRGAKLICRRANTVEVR